MVRRKGERKLEKSWPAWSPLHPVAQMMATGDTWFGAWSFQANMAYVRLGRESGIPAWRFAELNHGDLPTEEEIEGLARAWKVDPADIVRTLPASGSVV